MQAANLAKPVQIFIPQKLAADQPYHLSLYITLAKSTQAAGVSFNSQYPKLTEQTHRVAIVRGEAGKMALDAGYTDAKGEYVQQVSVPFDVDTGDYRLDLYVYPKTYLVQLNGQTLIEQRPLFYPNGLSAFTRWDRRLSIRSS